MYRKEFIERLSQKGYSKLEACSILDNIISVLEESLVNGESVSFRGFGRFEVRDRVARRSVDPHNHEIYIPAYKAVHFTPSKALKREIKTGSLEQ